jgi:hypothetical protein
MTDNEDQGEPMPNETITLSVSRPDAEVLLGVLAAERHNAEVDAVCDGVRKQLDEKLAELVNPSEEGSESP